MMKLDDALTLIPGDKVMPKKKNQYQIDRMATVRDVEITEVDGEKYVDILLDDGKWYGYKEIKF